MKPLLPRKISWRGLRTGVALIEITLALSLSIVLALLVVQLLATTALQRRVLDRRVIALQQVANLLEEVALCSYEIVTLAQLEKIGLAPDAQHLLPQASVHWALTETSDTVAAKRVTVTLTWVGAGNRHERPVRLTAWRYQPENPPLAMPSAPAASGNTLASTTSLDSGGRVFRVPHTQSPIERPSAVRPVFETRLESTQRGPL